MYFGRSTGKFLERRPAKHAGGTRNINALDFALGRIVELNHFRFVITDASGFTFKYLEEIEVWCCRGHGCQAPPPQSFRIWARKMPLKLMML
jgi:hypothetical protein